MFKFKKIHETQSLGQKIADKVAATVGSWKFIIIQSTILAVWIFSNSTGFFYGLRWDAPPFILLNLCLSFQAAYTAPIIMMSQNRQSQIDRKQADADYKINKLAEKEIELIQAQLDSIHTKLESDSETKKMLKAIHEELRSFKKTI
jgi:uncharacterized membrane protein